MTPPLPYHRWGFTRYHKDPPAPCPSCGCPPEARHTPDTTSPQIMWCHRCHGGCTNPNPQPPLDQPITLGTPDFGHPPGIPDRLGRPGWWAPWHVTAEWWGKPA